MRKINMRKILAFILWTAHGMAALAQTPMGSISGTVIDARSQEPLIAVNVIVLDTNYGASTDLEGRFTITRLPVGAYRLRFDYIGYEPLIKTDVIVK
ncbi:MAG: carboxypeptidase-like regulatory domain-containing protein, partial [Calditrichaeota bacterium]